MGPPWVVLVLSTLGTDTESNRFELQRDVVLHSELSPEVRQVRVPDVRRDNSRLRAELDDGLRTSVTYLVR